MVDFSKLNRFKEREFVGQDADLTNKDEVVALYKILNERDIFSKEDLEKFLMDRCELEAALDQAGSTIYIQMTCQTDDESKAKAYQDFIQNVAPAVKPLDDQLNRKYNEAAKAYPLDKERYEIHDRAINTDIELFCEKNIPLQTKIALLSQEYQTTTGAMTVDFDGEEKTMPEMGKFQLDPDRSLRERAWQATVARRLQDRDKLDDLFNKMLKLRHEVAINAGFENYRDYKFKAYHRFDYTPNDCKKYHEAVEKVVVPLWGKVLEKRKQKMGVDVLRPWDLNVDPLGRTPLKPFEKVEELIGGVQKIFDGLDSELGKQFQEMNDLGVLDLASRKGKAPGGYQSTLAEARKPFIFMNAVGVDQDVWTLLHEGGHAFHALATANEELYPYRHAPMEFNEVASMGMELMGSDCLNEFYSDDDAARSREVHLNDIIHILCWVANIDAFQHWIYENPQHTTEERSKKWVELYDKFGGCFIDWSGLAKEKDSVWHRQLHIFEVPFYYIEYAISQLGALQLWLNAKDDKPKTLVNYRRALELGGAKHLPELYEAAGIKFDFSKETIEPLVEAVRCEIDK